MGKKKKDDCTVVQTTRLHDADIERIAHLVATKISDNLGGDYGPFGKDCGGGFRCSTKYQCDDGFTCYSFNCQRDFVCETGNLFVCPQSFNCANSFTRDTSSAADCD